MNKAIYMETILNAEEIAASVTASASDHPLSPSATPQTLEEKWEKAGIGNAFIFGKVMSTNTDLLLELLQLSLPELEIREISDAVQEVYLKTSIDAHASGSTSACVTAGTAFSMSRCSSATKRTFPAASGITRGLLIRRI